MSSMYTDHVSLFYGYILVRADNCYPRTSCFYSFVVGIIRLLDISAVLLEAHRATRLDLEVRQFHVEALVMCYQKWSAH